MSIAELLANTLSADQQIRSDAEKQLQAFVVNNYGQYAALLAQELANESAQAFIRTAAGLALKNTLISNEGQRKLEFSQRWLSLEESNRANIRQTVFTTLSSPDTRTSSTAAQVVAAIAAIELPQGQWPDLIKNMLDNVQNTDNTQLKQATLTAIGFVCESIEPEILAAQSGAILTCIVSGARKEEQNQEVRRAAIVALYNSLEFTRENFEREGERNYIMQIVCEATQSTDVSVQVSAFECLVRIMQIYYDKMRFYMEKALFGLTVFGMKHEDERVALQAVEFWSTVCEEEIDLAQEALEAAETGDQPDRLSHNFAKAALPEILPVLMWLLTKQEEEADEEDWNVSMGAGTCLALLAQCVEDAVVGPVIPFVENNIRSSEWRYREAAVMAFGSILEGPDHKMLANLVNQALPVLIDMMKDPSPQVKDTTAWTLGRVSYLLIECIKPDVHLHPLIASLVYGLKDSPRIVSNCCWAIMSLSDSFGSSKDGASPAYPLSPYFEGIVTELLTTTERTGNESNARTSAYECISSLVTGAALDCFGTIQKLTVTIIERLELSITQHNQILGQDERTAHSELQSNLCSVLTSIIRKLRTEVAPFADRIMTTLITMFGTQHKASTTLEDGFLAVGAMTTALETDFTRYLDAFAPYLYQALSNHEEHQLCSIAVGLIGDICRALQEQSLPYCDTFMNVLLQNLQSPVLHRDVKPAILSCFGDIALAISGRFDVYLEVVMMVLSQASNMRATENNYDMIEYVNNLREGILEAYVGIVQGLKTGEKADSLAPYVNQIFQFLSNTYNDPERGDTLIRGIIGLLGDLAEAFNDGQIKAAFHQDWVSAALKEGRTNRSMPGIREVTRWAKEVRLEE
ncbi:7548_t:CDS:10 [Ambispora gerdemannii]|uniref:Importin-95 n=1 Tax=Ambispora gerdemannii TaxID=144530 RepID=A0A9N8ZB98_9GLOM|nr:7548_t:CDS:10 [Ambispora gerdemannii]